MTIYSPRWSASIALRELLTNIQQLWRHGEEAGQLVFGVRILVWLAIARELVHGERAKQRACPQFGTALTHGKQVGKGGVCCLNTVVGIETEQLELVWS